jgi:5-methylcytosine-specific restriction protein A
LASVSTRTFLLLWNPRKWEWPSAAFDAAVEAPALGAQVDEPWSVGGRRHGITPGDRAFLLRVGSERGLVGSGWFTSALYWDRHWDNSGRDTPYARVRWDTLLHPEDRLSIEPLKQGVPSVTWDRLQASGVEVPPDGVDNLENLWDQHVDDVPAVLPGEEAPGRTYPEGTLTTVLANRYERDRRARQKCIEHWGTSCAACGFDFRESYGDLGEGFIIVHHLRELSSIGGSYRVDPVKDLRPLCPNCHAMIHRERPALSVEDLMRRLRR